MLIHVSEASEENELRRGQTFCKECDNLATIRLVERVRTVTAYWVLKSTERTNFLICDRCGAQFRVKRGKGDDLASADVDSLMRMAGGRFVPFLTRIIFGLAVIAIPMPVFGTLLVWLTYRDRAFLTPGMLKVLKFALWANLAVTAAFVIALAIGD
jgi:hypothetical protein